MASYQVTTFKSGNSLVVTIPKWIALQLNLQPGDTLHAIADPDGRLIYGRTYDSVNYTHRTKRQRRRS